MVQVHLLPPLPKQLGFSETIGDYVMQVALKPGASLNDLFLHLSERHPIFQEWANVSETSSEAVLVKIGNKFITRTEYRTTFLADGVQVTLMPVYRGG